MMHPIFVRKVFDPLVDVTSGKYTCKAYSELMKTQWLSEDELIVYQEKKLRRLINHVYEYVPYYRNLFKKNNIVPSTIKSLRDLEKIPISDKTTIRNSSGYPNCMFARSQSKRRVTFGHTGGTTGEPLILARDINTRSYTWAAYWRWLSWMGLNRGDKSATIWGQPVLQTSVKENLVKTLADKMNNTIRLNAYNLNNNDLGLFTEKIMKFKPKHLHGYTSSMIAFARYVERNSIDLPPMKISTTAEVLEPHHRQYLQHIFGNEIFDQFGCGECNSIAFECGAHEGLHVSSEHLIAEISDDCHKYGENKGELILTDLDNFYMPVIRYKNGDVIEIADEQCTCGRNLPLIKSIGGRIADLIVTPNGKNADFNYFRQVL
ncbi:MAG: phenylacetate--CoA ligase family protein, partial [Clostridiales bacterium]|nr:phenylacetate--CoA ligase family protein [Clostridiales bacterium]